jgi:hypothetical protein
MLPFAAHAASGAREVKALGWTGSAEIGNGDKTIRIGVRTRIEPFVRARSETWLIGAAPPAPEEIRTLIVEPDGGWSEAKGERKPLPAAQAEHERQQYGIYGYLLMAARRPERGVGLTLAQPGFPPFRYTTDDMLPVSAEYSVTAPEGDGTMAETIRLEGRVAGAPIAWPSRLRIDFPPGGFPAWFVLTIDTLDVEFA